jgi:hypothetical protein
MKLFKLGERDDFSGKAKTPSLSDYIFRPSPGFRNEFKLLLDLYDETWVLEHNSRGSGNFVSTKTTAIIRVKKYSE